MLKKMRDMSFSKVELAKGKICEERKIWSVDDVFDMDMVMTNGVGQACEVPLER